MTSVFTWLDHSEEQRRQVLDVLDLFREQGTVDELGLGTIRDAFADIFFPGTSALMTRARYYLFVPWIYTKLERQRTPSAEIGRKGRRAELDLVERLLNAGETDGVIGRVARASLVRLPSGIYWAGMRRLGICRFDGSQDRYHRSLDRYYQRQKSVVRTDDGESIRVVGPNWHSNLPEPGGDFGERPTLRLSQSEAEYVKERIQLTAPESLFAYIVNKGAVDITADFPWLVAEVETLPSRIAGELEHARNFSEVMHGAALLYNLMLAELTNHAERLQEYQGALERWSSDVEARSDALNRWDRSLFWRIVQSQGAQIGLLSRSFVESWWQLIIDRGSSRRIATTQEARDLVHRRERQLKGPLARLDNQRARELWRGASFAGQLSYRWSNARRICVDILQGQEPSRA